MTLETTATYAALLGIVYVAISAYVSFVRGKTDIGLGDGGNPAMLVAIRRHGNFAEYAVIGLLLMALAEAGGLPATWLHVSGSLLVAGRLIHPFGLGAEGGRFPARVAGMLATWAAILIPSLALLGGLFTG
jgi:uncharacterized membrane protein YecN with MAPEG domain